MQYIVIDLEWNGGYSKKAHGYFNEIIEVGAVKTDDGGAVLDTFQTEIRPVVSRKISGIVTDLTSITAEDLENGTTFAKMMKKLAAFIGSEPATVVTWSTTDLLVLMENCRFFTGRQEIPFLRYYLDGQAYVQRRLGQNDGQQIGLSRAAEQLEIPVRELALHRALDDSRLTVSVMRRVWDREALEREIRPVNEEFYRRITFKTSIIADMDNPLVKRSELRFDCPECGKNLSRTTTWRFHSRAFCAEFRCKRCQKEYRGRVQYRQLFDGVECRKKLNEKLPPAPETPADAENVTPDTANTTD